MRCKYVLLYYIFDLDKNIFVSNIVSLLGIKYFSKNTVQACTKYFDRRTFLAPPEAFFEPGATILVIGGRGRLIKGSLIIFRRRETAVDEVVLT